MGCRQTAKKGWFILKKELEDERGIGGGGNNSFSVRVGVKGVFGEGGKRQKKKEVEGELDRPPEAIFFN